MSYCRTFAHHSMLLGIDKRSDGSRRADSSDSSNVSISSVELAEFSSSPARCTTIDLPPVYCSAYSPCSCFTPTRLGDRVEELLKTIGLRSTLHTFPSRTSSDHLSCSLHHIVPHLPGAYFSSETASAPDRHWVGRIVPRLRSWL